MCDGAWWGGAGRGEMGWGGPTHHLPLGWLTLTTRPVGLASFTSAKWNRLTHNGGGGVHKTCVRKLTQTPKSSATKTLGLSLYRE